METPSGWTKVRAILERAIGLDAEQRASLLDRECGADDALRAEVESLLSHDVAAIDESLSHPDAIPREPHEGWCIGAYRIAREIGSGGMGKVYLAERDDGQFSQRVAIKIIKRGMDTEDVLRRFRNERQVLADLEHPGIARLINGGSTDDGRPYLVIEYVDGSPIDAWCDDQRLGLRERIELFLEICRAVEHAHQALVIHRDLKPSNILVTREGDPKLLDFGIAKVLTPDGGDRTRAAERVFTPAYASPEQLAGGPITTRTDVFSLGVILYELLCGVRPFDADARSTDAGAAEPPRRPSLAVPDDRGVAEKRNASPASLSRQLAGDLDTIILTALQSEPGRRYSSVGNLAADLSRHLGDLPVLARADTLGYRSRKWVQRNQSLAAATVAGVLILVAGSVVSTTLFFKARAETARADAKATEANANESRALESERVATQRANDVLSLSAIQELKELVERADTLWPVLPDKLADYDRWLADAKVLIEGRSADPARGIAAHLSLKAHEAKLAEIRQRAKPWTPEKVESDRRSSPGFAEWESANTRRTYEFDDPQDRWWHAQLSQLTTDLRAFTDSETGLDSEGTSERHGWGIARRRKEAATIEERSVKGPEAERRWTEAVASIAKSGKYGGLRLAPQLGLLPLGEDPDSHLWEFVHLETGDAVERGADGKLLLKESMGLVFVLVPAGTFWMGAQQTDPGGHNYDPQANDNESPPHEVTLDAFFLSKYEMTQGQWGRLTARNPSQHGSGSTLGDRMATLLDPVEQVSWLDCKSLMDRTGLVLPTEAQWEYAARGGTETPWWTGEDVHWLDGAANLADSYCQEHGGPSLWTYEDWLNDGFSSHAPVGSLQANAFGLHDVIGNVWEWCRDDFGAYTLPMREGDGERLVTGASFHVERGGGFSNTGSNARSAIRYFDPPGYRYDCLGLRPARGITH